MKVIANSKYKVHRTTLQIAKIVEYAYIFFL